MSVKNERSAEKMRTEPVPKLLLSMGLPMILSMAVQAFYNIADSFFVSRMEQGEAALNALTLAFPVQMLLIAVGVGTGVGINSLLARSLGESDRKKASLISGNAVTLGVFTYIAFLLFGIFAVNLYLKTQTREALLLEFGGRYLTICTIFSFGGILFMIYEKLLQATGKTLQSTIAQLAGAVTNIVLDPVMIFGLAGCPKLGVAGAAYATVIGQCVSLAAGMYFHHRNNSDLDTGIKYFIPHKNIIAEIYKIGVPAIIMQALMSFMNYGANIILARISAQAVTAYGIYYRLQQFVFMASFGINNALIPVVAFNYGAKDKVRTSAGIRYGTLYTVAVMLIGAAALQVFARRIAGLFDLSGITETLCVNAIRVITAGYIFAGVNISLQGVFQAFGKGMHSLFISLLRLIVITLPAAYIFTLFNNAQSLVWAAFPAAEFAAFITGLLMYRQSRKERSAAV